MPLLGVNNLKKSFVTRVLFEGISFDVEYGDHIGFVGVNGCGKSTLFRMILGEEPADEGYISISSEAKIGSMQQTVSNDSLPLYDYTLEVFSGLIRAEEELDRIASTIAETGIADARILDRQQRLHDRYYDNGGATYRARTRSTLLGLGFTDDELSRPMSTFSGGQRNKAQLARLLLSDANLLLLDEPTNHLDISSIEWLENFLSAYRGAFIVISHDRYFLDKVTNRTIEMKDRRLYISRGNYSRHIELRSTARELEMREYLRKKKEIRRIEGMVEQQRRWGQAHNFITAASKQKQADRIRETLVEPERDSASIHFHFEAKEVSGNDVLVAKQLSKSFDGKPVFKNVDLLIKKGEKVFILGDNGCGKTTLLNILAGRLRATSGSFYLGAHVEAAYYEQTLGSFDPNNTVLREVWDRYYTTISHKDICNALAAFLFRGDDVNKQLGLLSGGELARVQLLKLMLTKCNLLLLDEPTNHLDIASREALESALDEYNGTMVIVTHDRYLVNRLADRIFHMTADGLEEYIGSYDDYIEALSKKQQNAADSEKSLSKNALDYRDRKLAQSLINRAKGEAERCEKAVVKAEAELEQLDHELASPAASSDYKKAIELSAKADKLRGELENLYKKWEEAEARLAELTGSGSD
ncbi:MAG: ABC-F family ATP-binding cassette domain-containing protein [Clostridia bacterium]|nr:ABC-F family ATP-binding cassette domain-containing protein [Clostridia bacterium]